jgi:CHRD domain
VGRPARQFFTGVMPKRFCSCNGKWEDIMRYMMLASAAFATAAFMLQSTDAKAQAFSTVLSGFEELGALNNETGAIFSQGQGTLDLVLNTTAGTLTFTLVYSGLSANILQSHIHFGKEHVPGGIMVFFCSNVLPPNGPPGTQTCPVPSGTVMGTLTASSVVGPAAQNVSAGNFNALVQALVSNTAYGNIHTTAFPSGEIRGQIIPGSLIQNQQNPPPR